MRAGGDIHATGGHLATSVTVPDGDAMPPPQLARDAPVMDIFEPVHIDLVEAFRHDPHAPIVHHAHSRCGQWNHFNKPLFGNERLYDGIAAIAAAKGHHVILDFDDQAEL